MSPSRESGESLLSPVTMTGLKAQPVAPWTARLTRVVLGVSMILLLGGLHLLDPQRDVDAGEAQVPWVVNRIGQMESGDG